MRNLRSFLLCIAAILSAGGLAHAAFDTPGTSGAQFLKLGAGARAAAMGEAYSAVTDGADAVVWNPAGLARLEGRSMAFMRAVYLSNISYDFASYAQKMGRLGSVGVAVQYLSAGSTDRTDEFGATSGSFNPYDLALSLSLARAVAELGDEGKVSVGLTGKFIQSKIVEQASTQALDIGVAWDPSRSVRLAAGVQNLGPALKFKNTGDDLPFNIRAGAAWQARPSLLLALDVNAPRDNDATASVGAELKRPLSRDLWIAPRVGYNSRTASDVAGFASFTTGAGLGWKAYSFDFAWSPFGRLGNVYRFGFSGKF